MEHLGLYTTSNRQIFQIQVTISDCKMAGGRTTGLKGGGGTNHAEDWVNGGREGRLEDRGRVKREPRHTSRSESDSDSSEERGEVWSSVGRI